MKILSKLYKNILWLLNNPVKFFYVYKQPLTKKPKAVGDPVSDLFVWRNNDQWGTYFELIDLYSIFDSDENSSKRFVILICFDSQGNRVSTNKINLTGLKRKTININEYTSESSDSQGTFCIFHSNTPEIVSQLSSYIAERGYVSYCYKKAPIKSFVHGNLDAISYDNKGELYMLGSKSLLQREYRLQYQLMKENSYDIAIANPTNVMQKVSCEILNSEDKIINTQVKEIHNKGAHIFKATNLGGGSHRLIIKSRLIMARPLIFCINDCNVDVFHG